MVCRKLALCNFKQANPVGKAPTCLYESLEYTEAFPDNLPPLAIYRTR